MLICKHLIPATTGCSRTFSAGDGDPEGSQSVEVLYSMLRWWSRYFKNFDVESETLITCVR
jgi:hypothetical protein